MHDYVLNRTNSSEIGRTDIKLRSVMQSKQYIVTMHKMTTTTTTTRTLTSRQHQYLPKKMVVKIVQYIAYRRSKHNECKFLFNFNFIDTMFPINGQHCSQLALSHGNALSRIGWYRQTTMTYFRINARCQIINHNEVLESLCNKTKSYDFRYIN